MKKIVILLMLIFSLTIFSNSVFAATCGNGILESGEECDDGNNNNFDGCANNCILRMAKIPVQSCTGQGELFLYKGSPFQTLNTSFIVNYDQLLIFAWVEASLSVKVNNINKPLTTVGKLFNYRAYLINTTPGSIVNVTGTAPNGARQVQAYLSQNAAAPIYDTNDMEIIWDSNKSNTMFLTPGNYSYIFFDKYTQNGPGQGIDLRNITPAVTGPSGIVVNKTYSQPFPAGTQGVVVDHFVTNQEGIYKLNLSTQDSIYWPLFDCLPLVKKPIKTCTGEGDLFLYQGDPFQEIATSFVVNHNQLLIFSKPDKPVTFNVSVNGVKKPVATIKNISTPFRVLVYSVNTTPGSVVAIKGDSMLGARTIQGYLSQDFASPVYDIANLQVIFDAQNSNIMSLTSGNYSFVFFDKYSINSPGQGLDLRKLTANVTGPLGTIFNQTYTQPSPFPAEGAVVGNFIASTDGLYSLGINTQDSIYWPLTQCPVECNGDLKYNVSMSVVGESCHSSNITEVNTTINVPLGAKYNIQGVVKRGNPGQCQTNEDFFLKINNKTGPATEDDAGPCAISLRVDPLGNFTFFTGINKVAMHTASICPPDNSPNSVELQQICLNRVEECGNGIVEENEQCDDGNQNNNDGCRNDCTAPRCGDNILDPGEECDDGNNLDNDGCNSNCRNEICGDGVKQNNEECDDGNTNNNDGCRNNCKLPFCGDGILDENEKCDDGNNLDGDGCSATCEEEKVCIPPVDVMLVIDRSGSMNILENGSTRLANAKSASKSFLNTMNFSKDKAGLTSFNELATLNRGLTSNKASVISAINSLTASGATNIGDGIKVGRTELAANGGANKFMILLSDGAPNVMSLPNGSQRFCFVDPTSPTNCTIYAVNQSNLTKQAGIEIFTIGLGVNNFTEGLLKDIATTPTNYFFAPNSTVLEFIYTEINDEICGLAFCGDGVIDEGEQCDDGNTNNNDACRNNCKLPFCGDNLLDSGEQCDDGNLNNNDLCSSTCTVTFCGDGMVQHPNGFGTGGPQNDGNEACDDGNLDNNDGCDNNCVSSTPICGNTIIESPETCDDGNTQNGDGCSSACRLEVCGNGIPDVGEECDDGNTNNNDACRNNCKLPFCGDGILDENEECDDGNNANGDGCSAECEIEHLCENPIDVMLVIDRSGSMTIKDNGSITRLSNAKTASISFLNTMNFSKDKAGLASFNQLATLNLGLTSNQGSITSAINALTATGATNIGDGIKVGRTELAANGGANKFMILLSDGAPNVMSLPNGSQRFCFVDPTSPTNCTIYAVNQSNLTKQAGIEIFTIGLGVNNFTEGLLKDIATTPTNYFFAPTSSELEGIYNNISSKICPP